MLVVSVKSKSYHQVPNHLGWVERIQTYTEWVGKILWQQYIVVDEKKSGPSWHRRLVLFPLNQLSGHTCPFWSFLSFFLIRKALKTHHSHGISPVQWVGIYPQQGPLQNLRSFSASSSMQLAIPWPNPDDLRKEVRVSVSTSLGDVFGCGFVAVAAGGKKWLPSCVDFFLVEKTVAFFIPGISTTETLREKLRAIQETGTKKEELSDHPQVWSGNGFW